MADLFHLLGGLGGQVKMRLKDMLDGTHALVVATVSVAESSGVFDLKTVLKNADYSATKADSLIRVNASGGNRTVTLLPAAQTYDAATEMGQIVSVKKVDSSANMVTISGASIDGAANFQLANQYDCAAFQSNGTSYDVLFRSQ